MGKLMLTGVVSALLLLAAPVTAGPACTTERPDISDQCLTTSVDSCVDAVDQSVTVQIGGLGAEDNNGDNGTCVLTDAVALVTFEKTAADQVVITIDNRTCNDDASLTALFHNITQAVTSYTSQTLAVNSGTIDAAWSLIFHEGLEQADGFGLFDVEIFNNFLGPNGGDGSDIRAGEIFEFTIGVAPGFNLCDFLTELSTPGVGERSRNVAGRWQACGPDELSSAYIGPCTPDELLLAMIDDIRLLPGDRSMRVEWSTSLEIQNAGFNVLRREATHGGWERVNVNLLPAQGDTVSGAEYVFVDDTALNGVEYMYRIEDIDFSGRNDLSEIRRDVTNPSNPRVKLTHPAYGATVDLSNRPRFAFADNGSFGHLIMQISADPTFAEESIVSTHVPGRFGSSEVTLSRRTARQVTVMAQDHEGIVYWRLVDRDRNPLSDTFRIEI